MPTPAGPSSIPTWTPTLEQVANYCTARTLVPQPSGSNAETFIFSSVTRPTSAQVSQIIEDQVAWLLLRVGTLHTSLGSAASMIAAIRSAGYVEMRYPERQSTNRGDAITTGEFLLKQSDLMLEGLVARNTDLHGGDDPTTEADHTLPVWSFPLPPYPVDTTY